MLLPQVPHELANMSWVPAF